MLKQPAPALSTIRAVIYDFDGTLARGSIESVVVPNYAEVFRWLGIEFTFDDYRFVAGLSTLETLRVMVTRLSRRVSALSLLDGSRFVKVGYRNIMIHTPDLVPFGTMISLNGLRQTGVKIAIATLAPAELVINRLMEWGYNRFFDLVISDGVVRPKPAPDIYLTVAQQFALPPKQCVGIEDTPAGIQSVRAAGMRAIGVRTAVGDEDLKRAGALDIVDDVRNITLEYLKKFERRFPWVRRP